MLSFIDILVDENFVVLKMMKRDFKCGASQNLYSLSDEAGASVLVNFMRLQKINMSSIFLFNHGEEFIM